MKKIFALLITILFIVSCAKNGDVSTPDEPMGAISMTTVNTKSITKEYNYKDKDKISPIIYYRGYGPENSKYSFLVIGGVKDKNILPLESFLYDGKNINELDVDEYNITSNLIMSGDSFAIFDANNKNDIIICKSVDYTNANIDSNHFVWAHFENFGSITSPEIGISCNWDPMPRKAEFSDNSFTADIIGNGKKAKIYWDFKEIKHNDDSMERDFEFVLNAEYNGKTYTLIEPSYYEAFNAKLIGMLDINDDNKLEMIFEISGLGSGVRIYSFGDNGFIQLLDFLIHSGP